MSDTTRENTLTLQSLIVTAFQDFFHESTSRSSQSKKNKSKFNLDRFQCSVKAIGQKLNHMSRKGELAVELRQHVGSLLRLLANCFDGGERGLTLQKPMRSWTKSETCRIGVAGLLKNQFNEVKKTCSDDVDLKFVRKNAKKNEFPVVDYLIVCTDYVSHTLEKTAKAAKLRVGEIRRCKGATKSVIHLVETLGIEYRQ